MIHGMGRLKGSCRRRLLFEREIIGNAAGISRCTPNTGSLRFSRKGSRLAIRVLIADDHEEFRRSFVGLLERARGFHVIGLAGDGHEAVVEAGRLQPDLVIMDVNMPEVGGIEATSQILRRWPQMRIVGLTADPTSVLDLLSAGARGCVFKGDSPQSIVAALKEAVARSAHE